jgi:hypothetical protein
LVIDAFAGYLVAWECSRSKQTAFVEPAIRHATPCAAGKDTRWPAQWRRATYTPTALNGPPSVIAARVAASASRPETTTRAPSATSISAAA